MVKHVLYLLLTVFLTSVLPAAAQEGSVIVYNDVVTGELTAADYDIPYRFSGKEDDVVVVVMQAVDVLADLDSPLIALYEADGDLLVDTSEKFSINNALLVFQLPTDGEYTVVATRVDGPTGTSVGEFTLALLKPEVLTMGASLKNTISSEEFAQFYVVQSEGPFTISYVQQGGQFHPELTVNEITQGSLDEVASLSGQAVNRGVIGLNATSNTIYVVRVNESLLDFNFDEITADYTLTLGSQE